MLETHVTLSKKGKPDPRRVDPKAEQIGRVRKVMGAGLHAFARVGKCTFSPMIASSRKRVDADA